MPRALADSVEAGMAPVPSVLSPPADIVAQNVLRDPTLRSLSALSLARLLSVSSPSAIEGIAAIVGLARSRGRGPLEPEPDLQAAIGPFMSTDTALARFGSHMGPIESNANPRVQTMTTAGAIGGYGDRFSFERSDSDWQMGFDNDDAGAIGGYGDNFQEAGLGEAPPTVVNDGPAPGPGSGPAPAPAPPSAAPILTSSTVFGLPLIAVAAAGLGAWLLLRKKGRRR